MADCGTCKSHVSNATQPFSTHAVIPAGIMSARNGLRMVVTIGIAELFDGPFA